MILKDFKAEEIFKILVLAHSHEKDLQSHDYPSMYEISEEMTEDPYHPYYRFVKYYMKYV